ncbi:unnamed protein product [marine sediment metagenome]|uniref:Uncharacterized protein n=1 Tax=marine sediment metagenome TaxID=412755 RepID=X1PRS3_9ZZZZ
MVSPVGANFLYGAVLILYIFFGQVSLYGYKVSGASGHDPRFFGGNPESIIGENGWIVAGINIKSFINSMNKDIFGLLLERKKKSDQFQEIREGKGSKMKALQAFVSWLEVIAHSFVPLADNF